VHVAVGGARGAGGGAVRVGGVRGDVAGGGGGRGGVDAAGGIVGLCRLGG